MRKTSLTNNFSTEHSGEIEDFPTVTFRIVNNSEGHIRAQEHIKNSKDEFCELTDERKCSDVRNNIPDISIVKRCDMTLDNLQNCISHRSSLMKIRKISPGLAKRLTSPCYDDDCNRASVLNNNLHQVQLHQSLDVNLESNNIKCDATSQVTEDSRISVENFDLPFRPNVENEDLQINSEDENALPDFTEDIYDECGNTDYLACTDSMKALFSYSYGPKNTMIGFAGEYISDKSQILTISPVMSECSQTEYSVSEDIEFLSVGEMPSVADGLSVCDEDDVGNEDISMTCAKFMSGDFSDRTPTGDVLDEKSGKQSNMRLSDSDVMEFFSSSFVDVDSVSHANDEMFHKTQKNDFDKAVKDIKLALENCNDIDQTCMTADQMTEFVDKEPVWIIRSRDAVHSTSWMRNGSCGQNADEENCTWPLDTEDNTDDDETDNLLVKQYNHSKDAAVSSIQKSESGLQNVEKKKPTVTGDDDALLIEGLLFHISYLGSTKLLSEFNPTEAKRMKQAMEAISCIKSPAGENQPKVEVDLFVSAEKLMVMDVVRQEVMMDYALQSISYVADVDNMLIVMIRPSLVTRPSNDGTVHKRQVNICCHVFASEQVQFIAEAVGRAFQIAYAKFLGTNGIDDTRLLKDINYEEILNQQQIFGEELTRFSNKDMQREITVTKMKGERLGIVIVESGWGSILPTPVVANLALGGPAAKSNEINIGDQIMAINGNSLVGLPLSTCQNYIRDIRPESTVRLTLVSCPPVVEVLIRRPDIKYQFGFSVQNGIICSLLRGGIGERGGIRVGHRIIEINGESVVAVSHEKIVHLLATSVGEIHMKTMPATIFRLLTGQDVPHFI